MFCIHEYQGERNYHCIIQLALIIVTEVLFYMIILLRATKMEKMNHGVTFCPLFAWVSHWHAWKPDYEQGIEYIFMKENKTVDKTFVTSASIRVNYLYKIINETVLVYSSACGSGSWMHTINIANTLRILAQHAVYVHSDERSSLL